MGIVGTSVTLYERRQVGVDPFNTPIYRECPVEVENVLIAPTQATDIVDNTTLEGAKAAYTLGIPKGDTHEWEQCRVDFWGEKWKAYAIPTMGIEENIPLSWNKKVLVARYE